MGKSQIEQMAKSWKESDYLRDKDKTIPENVTVIKGEYYHEKCEDNLLEMYYVKEENKKYPVVVSVHGGGYFYGDISLYQYYCAYYATHGFFVVSFNYKLAPKAKFPEPVISTNQVMEYLVANKDKYNLDLDNVFMMGDSAGAQICSQYAVIHTNKEYSELMEIKTPDFTLRAAGFECGCYDISIVPLFRHMEMFKVYFGTKFDKKYRKQLKVMKYVTKDFPPSYLISFKKDFLKGMIKPMYKLLLKRKVEAKMKIYGDNTTGHNYELDVAAPMAIEADLDQIAFFKAHIH